MARNIELKARLRDLERARAVATGLATDTLPDQDQVDTYFNCHSGRLKLREIQGGVATLIAYARDDRRPSRPSRYELLKIDDPQQLKRMLATTLGVRRVVEKRRQILLYRSTRIHLDQVVGLGDFIEFEAVLREGERDEVGHRVLARLQAEFGLEECDLVACSYSDLLEELAKQ